MAKKLKDSSSSEDRWIDIHDDAVMNAMGFPRKLADKRDPSVWEKTSAERKALKKAKRKFKNYQFSSSWGSRTTTIPCVDKLIIQVNKFSKDIKNSLPHKSTISYVCAQHQIPNILANFTYTVGDKVVSNVKKFRFNNVWYDYGTLPYYFGDAV